MFFLKKKNYQTPNIINKFQGHEKLQAECQVVAEALGCFFVFNRTFLILDLSDFSPPLLIRFRLCSPGQKNYISDAVSPWCQIWRWMMSSCPLWVIFDHLFGQNVWFFFFFYPLELTDLWGDILGLCKYPTVHQNFTLGLTCTGDWFLPEPIFSVVVIKMVVFQLAQLVWGYGLLVFSVVYNLLLASSFSHFIFIYFVFHGESPGSQHYQKHLIICSII